MNLVDIDSFLKFTILVIKKNKIYAKITKLNIREI